MFYLSNLNKANTPSKCVPASTAAGPAIGNSLPLRQVLALLNCSGFKEAARFSSVVPTPGDLRLFLDAVNYCLYTSSPALGTRLLFS